MFQVTFPWWRHHFPFTSGSRLWASGLKASQNYCFPLGWISKWNFFGLNIYICLSSAPCWQTTSVCSWTPGEELLTVASQERQAESLPLIILTPRGQEAEGCHAPKRAVPETAAPRVQVRMRGQNREAVSIDPFNPNLQTQCSQFSL